MAGLVDGEGCIRHDGDTEQVSVTSCYPHHLMEIRRVFGFGRIREIQGSRNHRTCYRIEMHASNARQFVSAILPFMREKHYQGQLMMAIRDVPKASAAREYLIARLKSTKKVDYALRTARSR